MTEHHFVDLANVQVKWGLTLRGRAPRFLPRWIGAGFPDLSSPVITPAHRYRAGFVLDSCWEGWERPCWRVHCPGPGGGRKYAGERPCHAFFAIWTRPGLARRPRWREQTEPQAAGFPEPCFTGIRWQSADDRPHERASDCCRWTLSSAFSTEAAGGRGGTGQFPPGAERMWPPAFTSGTVQHFIGDARSARDLRQQEGGAVPFVEVRGRIRVSAGSYLSADRRRWAAVSPRRVTGTTPVAAARPYAGMSTYTDS